MLCLGIEGTAHTFGVGIVDSRGKVIANASKTYVLEKGATVPFISFINYFRCPLSPKASLSEKHLARLGVRMAEVSNQDIVVEKDIFSMFPPNHRRSALIYKIAIEMREKHGWGARIIARTLNVKEGGVNQWFLGLRKPRPIRNIEVLSKIKLIPLKISNSLEFLQFIRVFGLRYGDGCISHQRRNRSLTCSFSFHDIFDAQLFCEDIRKAWGLNVKILPGPRAFYVFLPASIGRLMACAGAPIGKMTKQLYRLSKWIFELPPKLKWEFVNALFSADGSAPRLQSSGTCCKSFGISLNSDESLIRSFRGGFMMDIWQLLHGLDVKASHPKIMWNQPRKSKNGQVTYPVKIHILTTKSNALHFLQHVLYRYCKRKAEGARHVRGALERNLNNGIST